MTPAPEPDAVEVYYHLSADGVNGPLSEAEAMRLFGTLFFEEFAGFDLDGRLVHWDELEEEAG